MCEILITVGYIALCVLFFSIAIAIHEFGHFVVALLLGLRVEAFSIGFGPAIWKKKVNGIEYRLSCIPLGGYVSLPDLDPEGTKALEGEAAKSAGKREQIAPWKQFLVALAGPFMNIVLAVAIALALSLVPDARFGMRDTTIGQVVPDGPAARAGLQRGDKVLSVGGNPVKTWTEMLTEIQLVGSRETVLTVMRCSEEQCSRLELKVTPERDGKTGAYYIMALSLEKDVGTWLPDRNPWKQLQHDAGGIFRVLRGLVTPKEMKQTGKALGGPVMIAEGIYRSVRHDFWDGLGFMRFLNVNLAVLNLLPIPVLDGGLILFALIAIVFRRPLPEKFVKAVSMVFLALLLLGMGAVIVHDVIRSYRIHTADKAEGAK